MDILGSYLPRLLAVLALTLQYYSFVLFLRVILSWFPNLDWSNPILNTISSITDPYLNAFRGLIPPLGGMDFSPIIAFLALSFTQNILISSSASLLGPAIY